MDIAGIVVLAILIITILTIFLIKTNEIGARLMRENKKLRDDLSAMSRLMNEELLLKARAMEAGKAMLREALRAQSLNKKDD